MTSNPTDSDPNASEFEVYVFPLTRVTLFPHTTKPLNIFEPRYVKMVNDAVRNNVRIALAYTEPSATAGSIGGQSNGHVHSIAGAGTVHILERRPDGTMLILLKCDGKVKLTEMLVSEEPYIKSKARWIEESNRVSQANIFILNRIVKAMGAWLSLHVPDADSREAFLRKMTTPEERVNAVCSMMVLDAQMQQSLLEMNSIDERLETLAMAIESEAPAQ